MPEMFGAKFPLSSLREKICWKSSNAIAAGATRYPEVYDQGGEAIGGSDYASEVPSATILVTRTGLIRYLVIHTAVASGAGQSFTYTVRINGVPTIITCVIAGAGVLDGSDLVNSAVVIIGDRITIKIVNSAGGAATSHAVSIMVEYPATRIPFERINFSSQVTTLPANTTRYMGSSHRLGFWGTLLTSETWTTVMYKVNRKESLRNLTVFAGSAPGAGETFTYTIRVNQVPTLLAVILTGAVQVAGVDITDVVQLDVGDLVTLQAVSSLAAAVTTHMASLDSEEGDYRAG